MRIEILCHQRLHFRGNIVGIIPLRDLCGYFHISLEELMEGFLPHNLGRPHSGQSLSGPEFDRMTDKLLLHIELYDAPELFGSD